MMYLAPAWSFAKLSLDCPKVGVECIKMPTFLGFEVCLPLQAKPASSRWCVRYHSNRSTGMQREVESCPEQRSWRNSACSVCSPMTILSLLMAQPQKKTLPGFRMQNGSGLLCFPLGLYTVFILGTENEQICDNVTLQMTRWYRYLLLRVYNTTLGTEEHQSTREKDNII